MIYTERLHLIREKKFLRHDFAGRNRRGHSDATLTDDHTLFLLNQQRERQTRSEKRPWYARLLKR